MTDFIEQDALLNTDYQEPPPTPHDHSAVSSFVATPRMDKTVMQKIRGLFVSDLEPMLKVIKNDTSGLRYILSITSNAYTDREDETITSSALKAYEESCYPGEGVFHCDNPYVWWHDDDVVMGEIVAVNYSEPFLVELIKELDDPVSKVLFDFAEKNGDRAGASHRFGYRTEDRLPNGDYLRIFKQESTYLPDRSLAANGMTYAGVVNSMASQQSNEWLDKIFKEATGVENVSSILHAKSGKLKEILAAQGQTSKAAKPPVPPMEAAVAEGVSEGVEDVVEEDAKTDGAVMDMSGYTTVVNGIYTLLMELMDAQMGGMETQQAFAKSLKALEDSIEARQSAEKAAKQSLEAEVAVLKQQVTILEKRLSLTPRRVADQPPSDPVAIGKIVENAEKAREEGETVNDPFWGPMKKLPTGDR